MVRGKAAQTIEFKHSAEKEMKVHFQTEDTLNNKEVEGSATANFKCLYLCTGYFAQPENFTTFLLNFLCFF